MLVRPSYVLGGQGMEIAWNDADIREYMAIIQINEQEHPILVDKYLYGKEFAVGMCIRDRCRGLRIPT